LLSSLESLFCVFSSSIKILVRSPTTLWAIILSRIVPGVIALQDLAVRQFVFLCSSCNKPGISEPCNQFVCFGSAQFAPHFCKQEPEEQVKIESAFCCIFCFFLCRNLLVIGLSIVRFLFLVSRKCLFRC